MSRIAQRLRSHNPFWVLVLKGEKKYKYILVTFRTRVNVFDISISSSEDPINLRYQACGGPTLVSISHRWPTNGPLPGVHWGCSPFIPDPTREVISWHTSVEYLWIGSVWQANSHVIATLICVCVSVCVRERVCVCECVHACVWLWLCVRACLCVYVCVCMCVFGWVGGCGCGVDVCVEGCGSIYSILYIQILNQPLYPRTWTFLYVWYCFKMYHCLYQPVKTSREQICDTLKDLIWWGMEDGHKYISFPWTRPPGYNLLNITVVDE